MQPDVPVSNQAKQREIPMTMHSSIRTTATIPSFTAVAMRLFAAIRNRHRMARELAMLRKFEPHMLADIGLSRFNLMPEEAQEALYREALLDSGWKAWT
jgi:uncharacterized protein YjiS (DUF1127 family)